MKTTPPELPLEPILEVLELLLAERDKAVPSSAAYLAAGAAFQLCALGLAVRQALCVHLQPQEPYRV